MFPLKQNTTATGHACCAAIGSRIRYLVDTPEAVWGALDAGDLLGAARRHLRAACVHACLTRAEPRTLRARFPVLQAQWPVIRDQKGDVLARAHALLRCVPPAPLDQVRPRACYPLSRKLSSKLYRNLSRKLFQCSRNENGVHHVRPRV